MLAHVARPATFCLMRCSRTQGVSPTSTHLTIESLIRSERWKEARLQIRQELKDAPASHWLWTRLSLTFYEQRRYREALVAAQRALELAPRCPLGCWDLAGALQMLGRHSEALAIYRRLSAIPLRRLAEDACGEGRAWARGLVVDSHFRMMVSYEQLGKRRAALNSLVKHLDGRGPGCRSIYPLSEARTDERRLRNLRSSAG